MDSRWLKGYSDSAARKAKVNTYKPVLDDLKDILERDFKKKEAVRDYSDPGWAHKQIAHNEYNQVVDELLKLITLKDKE